MAKKTQWNKLSNKRFGDNLDDFWPRYCKEKVLDLSRVVEAYSYRINFKLFKRGKEVKEEYAFSVDEKTQERIKDKTLYLKF